jgi:hypothetical protein
MELVNYWIQFFFALCISKQRDPKAVESRDNHQPFSRHGRASVTEWLRLVVAKQ